MDGFFPKDALGDTIANYGDFNSALPLLTFILSLLSSSFGMTKFFLSGPIQFLPNNSSLNGILSIPFLSLFLINSMFGFRIVCIESAFFTNYVLQEYDYTINVFDTIQISPIISPEYRVIVYLAPCLIPFLINAARLWCTTNGLWKYFIKYPQFIISPCFTPLMFEGYETNNQKEGYKLKIWKWGTIINAIYIGCIPQCILCITDYYKGVHDWNFVGNSEWKKNGTLRFENNDALFKSEYGNTIFALTSATFFFGLIIIFFGSNNLFREKGIHCRCLNVLFCPCPTSCINLSEPDLDTSSSLNTSDRKTSREKVAGEASQEETSLDSDRPQTEVYLYSRRGEKKIKLLGTLSGNLSQSKLQVTYTYDTYDIPFYQF